MDAVHLRRARRRDLGTIAELWLEAFAGDPYLRWIQPDDARWPAFGTAWLTFMAELAFEQGHISLADPADVAAAWIPPDVALAGPDDIARGRSIIAEHAGEARADDSVATVAAARRHALDEPHWTLHYLGVRPSRQGAGLGAAAVAPTLSVCDAESLPCALISTNPRNVSFYERLGFGIAAEVATPDGAAVLRPMHRPPGPSSEGVSARLPR